VICGCVKTTIIQSASSSDMREYCGILLSLQVLFANARLESICLNMHTLDLSVVSDFWLQVHFEAGGAGRMFLTQKRIVGSALADE
jgi:hypothetical protein